MINFCTVTFAMIEGAKRMSDMSFVNLIYSIFGCSVLLHYKLMWQKKGVIFLHSPSIAIVVDLERHLSNVAIFPHTVHIKLHRFVYIFLHNFTAMLSSTHPQLHEQKNYTHLSHKEQYHTKTLLSPKF